jgi:N-acetylmuramoyl-L-alanine amidase
VAEVGRLIGLVLMLTAPAAAWAAAELRDLRLWDSPEGTRVVFDLSDATRHRVFSLSNPERIVVDIDGVDVGAPRAADGVEGRGVVQRVRTGNRGGDTVRVVLDVSQAVSVRSFALAPTEEYGHRLVIDLGGANAAPTPESASVPAPAMAAAAVSSKAQAPGPSIEVIEKPIVVAVDAGHGGEDPGARGRTGLLEKEVTLSIARRLARLINEQPGMKAVLTRDGDYYVGLRERVNKARSSQADLFVSIHANAYKDRDMHGSAVYTLSNRGATSEQARWLANKENAADLVGGIELHGKDDDLAKVLIDLSQDATMEASFDIGERVLRAMGKVNTLQKRAVQQAGFAVLKAPDIPSVLVETAFITNSREEKLLRDKEQQEVFASAILEGIKGYFSAYRPHQQVAGHEAGLIKVSNGAR